MNNLAHIRNGPGEGLQGISQVNMYVPFIFMVLIFEL